MTQNVCRCCHLPPGREQAGPQLSAAGLVRLPLATFPGPLILPAGMPHVLPWLLAALPAAASWGLCCLAGTAESKPSGSPSQGPGHGVPARHTQRPPPSHVAPARGLHPASFRVAPADPEPLSLLPGTPQWSAGLRGPAELCPSPGRPCPRACPQSRGAPRERPRTRAG